MKNINVLIRLCKNCALVISVITFMVACGGGGGGGGAVETTKTTMQGTITKGIIKGAVVDVYAVDGGAVSDTVLVSATTGDAGTYSITIPETYSGPVLIEMHNNTANDATMTCDIPVTGCSGGYNFGQDMPLGGLVLRTYVGNVSAGSSQSASVTPLTTMAAAYAEDLVAKGGSLNTETIATANSKVANLLGINNIVLTTAPDITAASAASSTKNELKYAYLSAALLAVADADFSGDISAALATLLANYLANGGELISNESVDAADVISLAELAFEAALIAQINDKEGDAHHDLWDLYQIASNPLKTDQPTETIPSPTSGLGELDIVKAFVSDVRTWGNVIDEETRTETDAFKVQTDAAGLLYDASGPLLEDALSNAVKAAAEARVSGLVIDLADYFDPLHPTKPVTATGTATPTGNSVSVIGVINDVSVNVQIDFPAELIASSFTATVNSAVVEDDMARLEISGGGVSLSYSESVDITPWLDGTITTGFPDPDSGTMDLAATITEKGKADPITLSGSLSLAIVGSKGTGEVVIRDVFDDVVQYNPENLSFEGSVSNTTGDSYSVTFSATMDNAATFMPLPNLEIGHIHRGLGSYSFSGDNTITIVLPDFTLVYDYDGISQVTVTESSSGGYYYSYIDSGSYASLDEFLASPDHPFTYYNWVWVPGEGSYLITIPAIWSKAGGKLDGVLQWPVDQPDEDVNNFRKIRNISISFTAKLTGLPEAKFTLTGNRTGFEDGNANLKISYGGRSMEISAIVVEGSATGDISIVNQDGAILVINVTDTDVLAGNVTYDGKEYATISDVSGVIIFRYIDGSFESL